MVKQYPYQLWAMHLTGSGGTVQDSVQDDNGDWVVTQVGQPGGAMWVTWAKCRDEVTTQNQTVTLDDATFYPVEALIYLPKTAMAVTVGTSIEVRDNAGTVRVKGICRKFETAQLHCRLWV